MTIVELYSRSSLKALDGIFERYQFPRDARVYAEGFNLRGLATCLAEKAPEAKLFAPFDTSDTMKTVLTKGSLPDATKAFPDGSFNAAVSLWNPSWITDPGVVKEMMRILKKDGATAVITLKDGAPKEATNMLIAVLNRRFPGQIRPAAKSIFPRSPKDMREKFEGCGFINVRAWEDAFVLEIPEEEAFEFATMMTDQMLTGGDSVPGALSIKHEYADALKGLSSKGVISIKYDFLGAIARR